MSLARHLSVAAALALSTVLAAAQTSPADAPTTPGSTAKDCVKTTRHDHGAERGAPTPQGKPCMPEKAAAADGDASAKGSKAKPVGGHNHSQFHKNQ